MGKEKPSTKASARTRAERITSVRHCDYTVFTSRLSWKDLGEPVKP